MSSFLNKLTDVLPRYGINPGVFPELFANLENSQSGEHTVVGIQGGCIYTLSCLRFDDNGNLIAEQKLFWEELKVGEPHSYCSSLQTVEWCNGGYWRRVVKNSESGNDYTPIQYPGMEEWVTELASSINAALDSVIETASQ